MSVPLQKLVAHLPRSRTFQFCPRHDRLDRRLALDIDTRTRFKPRRQIPKYLRHGILPEWWIEENHVETFARSREIGRRVAAYDLDLAGGERGAVALELGQRGAVFFHQHHPRRATRSGLETQRAAAGIKIQAPAPLRARYA